MSNNIERCDFENYPDFIIYRTTCNCLGHSLDLMFEYDKEVDSYILSIGSEAYLLDYSHHGFLKKIWSRIKIAVKILVTGYAEVQSDFIFRNENHIRELLTELQKGLEEIKKNNSGKN